jgi:glucose uptake protein
MSGIFYALITVLAWGTWLVPSQGVRYRNQQIKTFHVAAANLALAFLVLLAQGLRVQGFDQLTMQVFWPPFIGGLIWALGAFCAFTGTRNIGIAKAFGIWAPLNIIVSIIWGVILFQEFPLTSPRSTLLLIAATVIIVVAVVMIIFAKGAGEKSRDRRTLLIGIAAAVGAGVLWGSYFIPIKLSGISVWVGTFPLAIGMFAGSLILALLSRQSLKLTQRTDYLRTYLTGLLWGVGNYAMLLLVDQIGAGKGFTIAQLSLVVNALLGVFWLHDPEPKSRAAVYVLIGSVLATIGCILLGLV